MVFNVFAHNRDDHAKNFAFRLNAADGEWSLSPAYDLTCSAGPGGEHTMTLAGEGRSPGPEHMLRLARDRDVSRVEASGIIEQVRAAVSRWPEFSDQAGVPAPRSLEIGRMLGLE